MGTCIVCGKPTRQDWHKYCDEHFRSQRKTSTKEPSASQGLPSSYLKQGYFDEKGNLRAELIGEQAQYIALELHKADMKSASLRRFFGKVKAAQRKLESKKDFQAILPNVLELEPYVNNAVTREVVPSLFKEFIEANLTLAKENEKAFVKGFAKHFEYVVAFFPQK